MMKLNFNKAQCFTVPEKLHQLLNKVLVAAQIDADNHQALTFNFRDEDYSVETGGYHPVEIRIEKHDSDWLFIYITDFSYQGGPFPELIKEIDVCFISADVSSFFDGKLNQRQGNMLLQILLNNFIEYYAMDAYQASITPG